jgi:hypothetical protein
MTSPPYFAQTLIQPFAVVPAMAHKPALKAGIAYRVNQPPDSQTNNSPSSLGLRQPTANPGFGVSLDNTMTIAHSFQQVFSKLPSNILPGLSVSELSTRGLTTSINLVQIAKAIQYQQQVWERTGTIVLQTGLSWFILDKITNSTNSFSSAMLDYVHYNKNLAYPMLAPVKKKTMPFWERPTRIPEHIAHWAHNNVQMPIQRQFGLEGNFRSDVLRAAALPHDTNWLEMSRNEVSAVKLRIEQIEGRELAVAFNKAVSLLEQQGNTPDVVNAVKNKLCDDLEFLHTRLTKGLRPSETLTEEAKAMLALYKKEHQLGDQVRYVAPAQNQLVKRLTSVFHLHDMIENGKESAIHAWVDTHIVQPQREGKRFDIKQASQAFREYLLEADGQWDDFSDVTLDKLRNHATMVLDTVAASVPRESKGDGKALEAFAAHKAKLMHVGKDNKMTGSIVEILEPLLKINTRKQLMEGFLERSTHCIMAQLALLSLATIALQGKALMWVVFHTFAKLDDPAHKGTGDTLRRFVNLPVSKSLSTASPKSVLSPPRVASTVSPTYQAKDQQTVATSPKGSTVQTTLQGQGSYKLTTPWDVNSVNQPSSSFITNPVLGPSVGQTLIQSQESVRHVN